MVASDAIRKRMNAHCNELIAMGLVFPMMAFEGDFPKEICDIFDEIHDDVVHLHYRYKLFKQLFGSQIAVDALNVVAPELFEEIRSMMLEGVLLKISALTDRPAMMGRENLTFERLVQAIEAMDPEIPSKAGLVEEMKTLTENAGPIRVTRNRTLAHNDYRRPAEPIPAITKGHIDRSIAAMEEILRKARLYFAGKDLRCEPFTYNDGDALINILREWENYSRQAEPHRWRSE